MGVPALPQCGLCAHCTHCCMLVRCPAQQCTPQWSCSLQALVGKPALRPKSTHLGQFRCSVGHHRRQYGGQQFIACNCHDQQTCRQIQEVQWQAGRPGHGVYTNARLPGLLNWTELDIAPNVEPWPVLRRDMTKGYTCKGGHVLTGRCSCRCDLA